MSVTRYTYNGPAKDEWPRPLISTVEVTEHPRHWRLRVWNRGGLAGELVVNADDGEQVLDRLLPRVVRSEGEVLA